MMHTVRAEWVKLGSTKGVWIAAGLFLVLSFGLGLTNAVLVNNPENDLTISNAGATQGVRGLGLTVAMVLAVIFVTREYRTGTIWLSFQATPRRWRVLAAKGLLLAALATSAAVATSALAIPLAGVVAEQQRHADLGLTTAGGTLAGVGVISALAVLLSLGVGALVRSGAVGVAFVVVWPAILEATIRLLPGIGDALAPYLYFGNAELAVTGRTGGVAYHWGQPGALAYVAVVSLVLFLAGIWAVERRDA